MKNIHLLFICLIAFTLFFSSCSEDETYSKIPQFSDITFSVNTISAGEKITAIAVQASKGSLLDRTTYTWTMTNGSADSVINQTSVIYDNANGNPSCTLTFPYKGRYILKFTAKYNISAQIGNSGAIQEIKDGTISYSSDPFNGFVNISKTILVEY